MGFRSPAYLILVPSALFGCASLACAQQFPFRELRRALPPAVASSMSPIHVAGDFDGNGTLDVVALRRSLARGFLPTLLANDGHGLFREVTGGFTTALTFPMDGAAGDLDGDGDLDLLVVGQGGNWIFLNDGTGRFTDRSSTLLPERIEVACSVALGDLDGDGDLDAYLGNAYAIGSPGSVQNRLFLNNGGGAFTDVTAHQVLQSNDNNVRVLLSDLDGDRDLDAFAANTGSCRVLLGSMPGYLVEWPSMPAHPTFAIDAIGGDVDGDGDRDVLVSFESCSTMRTPYILFRNEGGLRFEAHVLPIQLRPDSRTAAIAFLDLEGDGDLDLYLGEQGGHRLLRNDGRGAFSPAPLAIAPPLQQAAQRIVAADFDGDRDTDLLISHAIDGYSTLLLNDGRGTLRNSSQHGFGAEGGFSTALALGDVDGDGYVDAVTSSACDPTMLYVHRNDGTGDLRTTTFFATLEPGIAVADLALADIDGDSDLDLYAATYHYRPPLESRGHLFRNEGGGVFRDVTSEQLSIGHFFGTSAAFGDLDGDGDQDLVVAANPTTVQFTGGHERLLWNDGTGRFTDGSSALTPENFGSSDIALGDIDGDGDLDILVAHAWTIYGGSYAPTPDSAHVNLGGGRFARSFLALPVVAESSTSFALGDIDRDGDLDLLVGTSRMGTWLHRNDNGRFARLPLGTIAAPNYPDNTRHVALADFDGDGWLDIAVANADASFRFYRCASPSPTYVEVTPPHWPFFFNCMPNAAGIEFADLDRDGDLDLVTAAHDRVLTNVTRQIARRGTARLGRPLHLDLYGPSGESWMLFAAASRTEIPLPPLGALRAGPLALHLCGSGLCDAAGRATASFVAPRDPALIGRTIYWQALIGASPSFSNLETTTFDR